MGIEGRVTQISLGTVAAFEIAALDVILRATLTFTSTLVLLAILVVTVAVAIGLLGTVSHILDLALIIA